MLPEPATVAHALSADVRARAPQHDVDGSFPTDDLKAIRDAGLLGLMVPEHLGGRGANFLTLVHVLRELARGSGATALIFNMHASVTGALASVTDGLARATGMPQVFVDARDSALRNAADGTFYQVAMSEHGAGSRFSAMTTTYQHDGDGWRITGRKTFCTGAGHADAYLVVAKSIDGTKTSQFLVPTGPGITVESTWDAMGMRATASNDLVLDTSVRPDALLGAENMVDFVAELMPHWLVASYAAVYVGVAEAALEAAVSDLRARGHDALPSVRSRVGRADAAIAAAWATCQEAARRVDTAPGVRDTNRWVYRAKLLAGDVANEVAASMVEACGTSATRRGHPLERLYRDARCGALQPATSDVCADWLGLATLGRDPHRDQLRHGGTARW